MKKIYVTLLSIAVCASTVVGLALPVRAECQCPKKPHECSKNWHDFHRNIFDELGLTKCQKDEIMKIKQEERAQSELMFKQLRDKEIALMNFVYAPKSTLEQALCQQEEITNLQNQLSVNRITAEFKIKAVLSPAQQEKYIELKNKRIEKFKKMHENFKNHRDRK